MRYKLLVVLVAYVALAAAPMPPMPPVVKAKSAKVQSPRAKEQSMSLVKVSQPVVHAMQLSWDKSNDSVYLLYISSNLTTWIYKGITSNTSCTVGILPSPVNRFYKVVASNTVSHFTSVQTTQFLLVNNIAQ